MIDRPLVFDAHCDVVQALCDRGVDLARRQRATHFDLPRARAGGLGAQFFALFADPAHYRGAAAWRRTQQMLAALEAVAARHPDRLALARSAAEIRASWSQGRLAALVGLEGAHGLGSGDERRVLARFGRLVRHGLRYLGLTWNNSNALAGAAVDGGGGLTALGRRVVRACQCQGVLIDVSHSSDRTAWDVLALVRGQIIASHSNARALCDVPRNLPDDLLRAIGRQGGVVCANFYPGFLDERAFGRIAQNLRACAQKTREIEERYQDAPSRRMEAERRLALTTMRNVPRVPLSRVVEHIHHLVRVAGEHAVGIGSDFDGILLTPKGLDDVSAFPRLERALARRLPESVVRGVLGQNLLRVVEQAESVA
ncbi:MAG: dipeptidase [Deltaproteobacteria bacterium]|nr:dipeptidase [Deltaproteobacteria bacterium]